MAHEAELRVVAAGRTDTGRQRRHNEDHVLVKPDLALFAVADGMGGHNAGDIASKLTTTSLANFFEATRVSIPPGTPPEDEVELSGEARRLVAAIRKANHDVFEISTTMQQHHGMGSTIVAAYICPGIAKIFIGHVGDSRCYRVRGESIELLTRDHSLVNDALAIKPDLSEDELARLPRNIITRALGMRDVVKVDLRTEELTPGDVYLLCSDGLSGMVTDDQILEVFGITEDLSEICELLIAMANDAGGADNITAVVMRVEEGAGAARKTPTGVGEPEPPNPRKPSAPAVEVTPEAVPLPRLDLVVNEETLDLLHAGAEIDVAAQARGGDGHVTVAKCTRCDAELIVGNLFCVECGARIP
jgi:protein phosphatase